MEIHHLNCGSGRILGGVAVVGTGGLFHRAPCVTHCLLVDTGDGLLLVDVGFGTQDCLHPSLAVRIMIFTGGHPRRLDETALSHVERLGYSREDVCHIALTHFHFDHAGGITDFPDAKVHIFEEEHRIVTQPRNLSERQPVYRPEHLAHGPDWQVHSLGREKWFGFERTPSIHIGSAEFFFVPLPGHTPGNCAVVLRLQDGWLMHCGDAYTFPGEVDPFHPRRQPYYWLIRPIINIAPQFRGIKRQLPRLRALFRDHGDELQAFCSHHPDDLAKF